MVHKPVKYSLDFGGHSIKEALFLNLKRENKQYDPKT